MTSSEPTGSVPTVPTAPTAPTAPTVPTVPTAPTAPTGLLTPVLIRMMEGRVGSTLLMQLLGTSPDVAFDRTYPFENSYLTYLVKLMGTTVSPAPDGWTMEQLLYGDGRMAGFPFDPESIDRTTFATRGLAALWQAFTHCVQEQEGGPRLLYAEKYWGDVTPVLTAGLAPVVIDVVRDPRDTVASIRAFNAKRGHQGFGRAQSTDDASHLRRLVMGMNLRLSEFELPLPVPHLLVRYEDLSTDLPGQAARLSALLGTDLSPDLVTSNRTAMEHHTTSPSVAASIGRWAADLQPEEAAFIERRMRAHMERLAYLTEPQPPTP